MERQGLRKRGDGAGDPTWKLSRDQGERSEEQRSYRGIFWACLENTKVRAARAQRTRTVTTAVFNYI